MYYVYVYFDPKTMIPFYVGYGKGDRILHHIAEAKRKSTKKSYKVNKIRSILNEEKTPIIRKIDENLSKDIACELEEFLIELIGRSDLNQGPLTNLTKGGEGNRDWSTEQRNICSQRNKGMILAKDNDGNIFKVKDDDPRWLNGELIGMNGGIKGITNKNGLLSGYILCRNLEGTYFRVKSDDPRWLSGELFGLNKGVTPPQSVIDAGKRRKGEKKSEEFGKAISERMKGIPKTEECKRKLSEFNKGLKTYNNGEKEMKTKIHPGEGWNLGRLRKQSSENPTILGDNNE